MIRTITGLFDTADDAQSVAKDLMDHGIPREDISMVARDTSNANGQEQEVGEEHPVGSGAIGGSMVGGAVGLLVGAGLLAIPGLGPVLAIGPLAATIGSIGAAVGSTALGAGVGASVGGIAGGLMGDGVPEESAHIYAEGVRRGGVLLNVSVDSATAERVNVDEIMHRYGVVDIEQRSKDWHKTDWDPSMPADSTYANGTNRHTASTYADGANGHTASTYADGTNGHTASTYADGAKALPPTPPRTTYTDGANSLHAAPPHVTQADIARSLHPSTEVPPFPGVATSQRSTPPITTQTDGANSLHATPSITTTHPDFAQGQRSTPPSTAESDFAQGQRSTPLSMTNTDVARETRGAYDNGHRDFQNHYQSTVVSGGRLYSDYALAYSFGSDMATDTRVRGHTWDAVEPDLHRTWEQSHPNSWDEFKAAVRYAWEKAPGQY